ncbi:NmrA/HSCARG family protein [Myceligenerans pegani]|uniref:NmrA/HSCARG family protein n=1 Tax=Myceligenerans pegani TaxID=2776917 RepID=A0ABR9MW95_9MICO|nr:NmrA/HSCARG family protein [Myceligenerans sp. TRM 65318]MBE1875652.1 NmrA/HSCARG family protein [Myceligenerans sp. TRM 65318]MBE3017923.1 NmrA/HSCARG family protein [Myceligenerans sp. TRM 65318]
MTEQKKIIAVVGATGAQGGGLAHAILADADSEFAVRALTRNPDSEKAQELARLGAEVVVADLDDEASVAQALDGAYGAYFVTNFWEHFSPEREYAQARNLALAARTAGVEHVVWSTLEDTRDSVPLDDDRMPTLMGKYKVPHFDVKGEANALFIEAGVPTTFLQTTYYWDGFLTNFAPTRQEDGSLVLALAMADSKLAGIASEDIGRTAYGIFQRGKELVGETVSIAGEHLTGAEYAAAFAELLGEPVHYFPVPFEGLRSAGFPAAEEVGNMFQYYAEFADEFTGRRDLATVRELNPRLKTFAEWLGERKDAFAAL